ncbi:MAG TPA: hypothetical protein VFM54_16820 [Micromonosporaceae bacterium]|nr:hypothetical protein [Micromonosporaceae bacterium]
MTRALVGVTRHGLSAAGVADAGAFLGRLHRLDPAALVRLRPAGPAPPAPPATAATAVPAASDGDPAGTAPGQRAGAGGVALWARLPWGALVTRTVDGVFAEDATVAVGDLLAVLAAGGEALPARRDSGWRWPLPPVPGTAVESVPAATVRALGSAAERALRTAAGGPGARSRPGGTGRVVGERAVRDALLDHVPIMVEATDAQRGAGPVVGRVAVPQRLVQAVVRMGFLGPSDLPVRVLVAGRPASRFVGLAAEYGTAWYQKPVELAIKAIG